MKKQLNFQEALHHRRSIRVYDPEKPIPEEDVRASIQDATLAPNSSNMQLWEFYHVVSKEKIKELTPICFGQRATKTAQQLVVFVARRDLYKKRANFNKLALLKDFGKKEGDPLTEREKGRLKYFTKTMPFLYGDFFGIMGWIKFLITRVTGIFKPTYRQVRSTDIRTVVHKSTALAAQNFMMSMASKGYDTCPMEGYDSLRVKKALNLPNQAEINMIISCGIRVPDTLYNSRIRVPFEEVYTKI